MMAILSPDRFTLRREGSIGSSPMPADLRLVRLQPEDGELGIGEIAQARMIGAAVIFAAAPRAVEAGELRNRPVRIHDDDRHGTKREEAPEIPSKFHKL